MMRSAIHPCAFQAAFDSLQERAGSGSFSPHSPLPDRPSSARESDNFAVPQTSILICLTAWAMSAAMFASPPHVFADEPLPNQEQAIERALENHPDIVAAKAKVALAEAELYGKRMEVSRQILGLYGNLKALDAQTAALKEALGQKRDEFERAEKATARLDQSTKDKYVADIQATQAQLVQAIGQREQAEKELRLLIGKAQPAAETKSAVNPATAVREAPHGPIVDQVKDALQRTISMEFTDIPVKDVAAFLTDREHVSFTVQRPALTFLGFDTDFPISVQTKDVSLRAAIQAIEDAHPDLQFVLRDYGILITTKDYAREHGYLPVLGLGKEAEPAGKSVPSKSIDRK